MVHFEGELKAIYSVAVGGMDQDVQHTAQWVYFYPITECSYRVFGIKEVGRVE